MNVDGCPDAWGVGPNCYAVGTSATGPLGPFTYRGVSATTQSGSGDFDLFVDDDDDSTPYLVRKTQTRKQ